MKLNRALVIAASLWLVGPAFADNGLPGGGGNGMPVIGTNQPSTYLPSSAYPTIVPAYSGTFTLTSGSNTFTVDATTALEISAGMSVISAAGFNGGTYIASLVGTTVTTANSQVSPNALVSGATAVQFGTSNRFQAPYVGATSIMAQEGFFGDASKGNTTWNYTYFKGSDSFGTEAIIALNNKFPAALFGTHTAGFTNTGNESTYPITLNAVNDNPTYANQIWGLYMQIEEAPGAAQGRATGVELSPVNFGVSTCQVDPYTEICSPVNQIEDLLLDAGNGLPGINNITDFIHLIPNGAKALHGIDVDKSALDFTTDPNPAALAMPTKSALTWYLGPGQKGWSIYDNSGAYQANTIALGTDAVFSASVQVPSSSAAAPGIMLGNQQTGFYNPGAAIGFAVSGSTVAYINSTSAVFTVTGFAIKISPQSCSTGTVTLGTWSNYSVTITAMPASGNCTVNLPASPISGQQIRVTDGVGTANTHNIVVTPAAGNIDGSATYTINTSYGAWSGEYETTFFKTVSKL